MASRPARKLEESSDEFNNLQLGDIDGAWRTKYDESNEKVLDAAKEIRLITDKTSDLINETLKNANGQIMHPGLFGKALVEEQKAAEKREQTEGVKIDKAAVFKRAFESVYGRFLLEQGPRMVKNAEGNSVIAEGEMEYQDHPFMKMLDKVLKVKVSPEFGLKGRSELQAVVRRLKEVTAARGEELKKIVPIVQSLIDNARLATLAPECKKECEDFMKKYKDIVATTDITTFINDTYKPFAAKIRTAIDEAKSKFGAALAGATTQVAGLDSEIKVLEAYKSPALILASILERAFGKQKTPDEMKALEDKHGIAERKKAALEEDKKYFGGDEVKAVDKKYKEILGASTSPSDIKITAASLRQKKAALDLKNDEKGKLEELKILFAEKKIGEVQDKFLELEGLLPAYLTSGAGDFEGKLAGKKSEADLLKGTIDNYEKTGRPLLASSIQQEKANLSRLKGDTKADPPQIEAMANAILVLETTLANKDAEFETNRAKFRDLGVSISQLEKFRDGLKAFRSDILDLARGCEKAVELGVLNLNGATKDAKLDELGKLKGFFNSLSVNSSPSNLGKLKENYDSLSKNFAGVFKAAEATLKGADYGVTEQQNFNDENGKIEKAKKLYEDLEPVVAKFVKAAQHGVSLDSTSATPKNKDDGGMETQDEADQRSSAELAHAIEIAFKAIIKPDHKDFKVSEIALFYDTHLKKFLGSDENRKALLTKINAGLTKAEKEVKDANKELNLAKEAAEKCKDLTDPQAALKIIGVLVAEQFPKLSMFEQEKLARLVLAGDVAKLQTDEGYEALAKRGMAEQLPMETEANLKALAIRGKLIGFKYQEGDKLVQPFKGMKPENFKDWASIEKLFNLGQLNYKNGFFLLAALEIFDATQIQNEVRSVQSLRVEEKLKMLLAKQLGVHERMHIAGVNKIVNDAFKVQMEKVRPLVKVHFENYGKKAPEANEYRVKALNLEYKDLEYKLRTGEIDNGIFDLKVKELLKKAEEADVLKQVNFSQDTFMSQFWNSKYTQWVRDKGINWSKLIGEGAARGTLGITKGVGMAGLHVSGKLGLGVSRLGVGAVKYPVALLTGIGSGVLSIFRRGKWWDNVKGDVGKVMGTAGGWQQGMATTSKKLHVFGHVTHRAKSEALKTKLDTKKHVERERVKKKKALREEGIKLFSEKAEIKPVEIAESPFIDLAEFKAKITQLDKILGTTTSFPTDTAKAGSEHKAGEKKEDHGKKDEPDHEKAA